MNLERDIKQIKQDLRLIKMQAEVVLNEKQACELLDIEKKTLQNYVSDGTIPPTAFSVGVGGKRFYYKSKLIQQ